LFIGTAEIDLNLPGVNSLKEKRRIVKSLLARLQNKFNISIAEVENNDRYRSAGIGMAVVSNDKKHIDRVIAEIVRIIESYPEVIMLDYRVEIL
jgi:uncharacterized protein